jgi:transcription-repair coupling factor (superfamily II helicase)
VSNLAHLLQAYRQHPAVTRIVETLGQQGQAARIRLEGLTGAQESFVIAASCLQDTTRHGAHLFVANSKEEAAYRYNDLEGLLPGENVRFFPDSFKRPAFFDDLNPSQILQRSEAASKMTAPHTGIETGKTVIVTYPEALFEKVVRPDVLAQSRIEVQKGEKLDIDFVISVLVEYGFERADFVYEPGQFSIRGGIIDLYSFGNDLPYRIELFDDEVETIRVFDPLSQLSQRNLNAVSIVPNLNTRFRQDQKVSLFRILPADAVIWIKDFQFLLDRLQYCFERAEMYAAKLTALDPAELREIFRDRAFLFPVDVADDIAERTIVYVGGRN